MVLTIAQTTSFFTDADQLGLTADQRARLQNEGLLDIEDLDNFDEDTLEAAIKNCSRSTPYQAEVTDNNGNVLQPQVSWQCQHR